MRVLILSLFLVGCGSKDWRTASRESAKIAPLPADEPEALIQIYAARAFEWRGAFAVHTWIATKKSGAESYKTYEVIGWRLRSGQSVVAIQDDLPDRYWYGAKPQLLYQIQGQRAEALIPKIEVAALKYPYPNTYRAWPGPNSNTFVSFILREIPEIGVELPPHAIGKDWIPHGWPLAWSETGTGAQFSILGVLGLTLGAADGFELNVLGLNFGLDFLRPALKLPLIGRLGFSDQPPFWREE